MLPRKLDTAGPPEGGGRAWQARPDFGRSPVSQTAGYLMDTSNSYSWKPSAIVSCLPLLQHSPGNTARNGNCGSGASPT